ncbi:MAG: hypothetical protein CL840_11715 [Crocinitomicaceae bacterium]|nr:hypothetical protein [Crocinitomicaceae bacterium]|tara:strand:- start:3607 stop:4866 length:1260 start_codon:yes stop_codon:yes gene_type:complete
MDFMYCKSLFIGWFLILVVGVQAQTRMVLNNDIYLNITNNVVLVIDNGNSNALTTSGTGGNIVSEDEDNTVKWNIGTNTGTYVVPLTSKPSGQGGNATKIPTTVAITTAGTGSGSISFSTYETTNDNNTPFASQVTHMSGAGGDQSLKVLDRFWFVNASGYTTKPEGSMTLSYDDASNEMGGTNSITESDLQAQRWNSTANDWQFLLYGTVNTSSNQVSGITLTSSDFFSTWAIVSNSNPLPVELIRFEVNCSENGRLIEWETASETNNERFDIQYSNNGDEFFGLTSVGGSGNSSSSNQYYYLDQQNSTGQTAYYRLRQVDFNGISKDYPIVFSNACENGNTPNVSIYPNPSRGRFHVSEIGAESAYIRVLNHQGQEVFASKLEDSSFNLNHLENGAYYCIIITGTHQHHFNFRLLKE